MTPPSEPPPLPVLPPARIANTLLLRQPQRLILRPANGGINKGLLLVTSFLAISMMLIGPKMTPFLLGMWGIHNVPYIPATGLCYLILLISPLLAGAIRNGDRLVFDRERNELRGRSGKVISLLSAVSRIAVTPQQGAHFVSLVREDGQKIILPTTNLFFLHKADAETMAQEIAGFLGVPADVSI